MIKNKGIYLAFATAFISGFAVFFNKFVMSFWANSSVFITAKNLVVAFLLVSLILLVKKVGELKRLSKKQWLKLVIIGFIGGSVPFLLFFKGLSLTSATNAAFIHKTLFIWVAFLAIPFLKEKISSLQFLALGILFAGVYLFISPAQFHLGVGEILALSATVMWAVENVIAKKVLKDISSLTVAWARMFFGSLFLLAFLVFSGNISSLMMYSWPQTGWLFFSGLILLGYVITWYSALKHAPATVVASVLVLAAPITALLNSIFVAHYFRGELLLPITLIVFGVLLFNRIFEIIGSFLKRRFLLWKTVS